MLLGTFGAQTRDMEEVVTTRSAVKRWATRAANQLERWTTLVEETRTIAEFEVLKAMLEKRLSTFDDVHNEWEAAADDAAVKSLSIAKSPASPGNIASWRWECFPIIRR